MADDYHLSALQTHVLKRSIEAWFEHLRSSIEPPTVTIEPHPEPAVADFLVSSTGPSGPTFYAVEVKRMTVPMDEIVRWHVQLDGGEPKEEVAAALNSTRASVSRAIKRLEGRGYIARVGDGVMVTEEGLARGATIWRDQLPALTAYLEGHGDRVSLPER